jgi:hypothetical protein
MADMHVHILAKKIEDVVLHLVLCAKRDTGSIGHVDKGGRVKVKESQDSELS